MTKPGAIVESGTLVIRDGFIQAVGANVPVPGDARVWDVTGCTVYAGFIEPYLVPDATNPPVSTSSGAPVSDATLAAGGFRFYGAPDAKTDMGRPGPGYGIARIIPEFRAAREYSPDDKVLVPLRELGFTAAVVAPARGIIRGTSALVALSDDDPVRTVLKPDVFQHIAFDPRAGGGAYPESLMGVIASIRQGFLDAEHYAREQADDRAQPGKRGRPEFNPALAALGPVRDRKRAVAFEPGSALMDDCAAQLARELGLDFCLVSCGQEWRRPDLAKTTGATYIVPLNFPSLPGLPAEEDWEQVTLDQLRAWDWAPENPALLRRLGREIALTTYGLNDKKEFRKNLRLALDRGLAEADAVAALTTVPARLCGMDSRLGTIEPGKIANLTVVAGRDYFDPDARVRAVWIDGRIHPAPPEEPRSARGDASAPERAMTNAAPGLQTATSTNRSQELLRELRRTRTAHSPLEGRGVITNPPAVLIRHATVWTCGPRGILTNAFVSIRDGKIRSVTDRLDASGANPPGEFVIDGRGLHVTPGLIDCHSHTAILGNVNEAGLPSTAMVRIRDVVNSESDTLPELLAGGVTTVNLLHGSANPIGGQNCVIKLRDGAAPADLVFSHAPPGIKFALGENVKQSNWGEKFTSRFPQSRMGVRTFIRNRFIAAQEYLDDWQAFRTNGGVPPRRDLELETIGEILEGKRWIHCHAYRQDEMLMLTRLTQEFGVRIGTFQHALEGYKIADELAAAGIGASAFSDWWALKFELYDAIPFNGSLMRDRGVLVSFNSDYSELARRLYLEAAKAVKYGGTPEAESLNFVTINAARQLRVDPFIGSLEPGKDADFALWSKSPLDSGTVCLQTWIDGGTYFDRALNAERVARLKQERDELIAKAKKTARLAAGKPESAGDGGKAFFHLSLEREHDGRDRHCLDE